MRNLCLEYGHDEWLAWLVFNISIIGNTMFGNLTSGLAFKHVYQVKARNLLNCGKHTFYSVILSEKFRYIIRRPTF